MKGIYINKKSNSTHKKQDCEHWDIDSIIAELNGKKLPISLVVSGFEKIDNLRIFIDTNEEIAKHNNGSKTFKVYYDRLVKLNYLLDKI